MFGPQLVILTGAIVIAKGCAVKFNRLWALTKIIFLVHVFNWPWRSRKHRHDVRADVMSRVATGYLKRYLSATEKVQETDVVKNDKNEKIFTMWLQGEDNAPPLVKACYRSVRKHCAQELVVLDEKTVFDYISLPDVIIEKYRTGKIRKAHFADICRVELLYKYGGYWLDSTGFVTSPISRWITDSDFFMYMVGDNVGQKYMFCQNCFIRARKGAYLLNAWREMILDYWIHENSAFDYFVHQLLFETLVLNDKRAKKHFAQMPHVVQDPTHALWWDYHDKPFDKKTFDKVTSDAFFQKTTYQQAEKPIAGSFADKIINM